MRVCVTLSTCWPSEHVYHVYGRKCLPAVPYADVRRINWGAGDGLAAKRRGVAHEERSRPTATLLRRGDLGIVARDTVTALIGGPSTRPVAA